MIQQHEPNITCINCDRSIHPVQYNKHYSACCVLNDENIANPRQQQIFDFNNEVNADDSELDDDEVDKIDVNDIEGTLACNLTDYVPIHRNRRAGTCGYYNSLLRIETLQFYDISLPVIVDDKQTIEYTEWTPKRCEKNTEQCNIVLRGIFTRFCYGTDELFLFEVKRYQCTTHYNIKKWQTINHHTTKPKPWQKQARLKHQLMSNTTTSNDKTTMTDQQPTQ